LTKLTACFMIKVGCCGFPTSMRKYYESFSLVEVQRTFYAYPRISTVTKWRAEAPSNFEFTVKAHQDISHRHRFKTEASVQAFEQMKQICNVLKAQILLIQTPASFRSDKLSDAIDFFQTVERDNITLVWETRGPDWDKPETRAALSKALKKVDVPHVVDPLKNLPVHTNDLAYFRLHGMGKRLYHYKYSDDELARLRKLIARFENESAEVYVLFNNLAMWDDATRFQHCLKTGSDPA